MGRESERRMGWKTGRKREGDLENRPTLGRAVIHSENIWVARLFRRTATMLTDYAVYLLPLSLTTLMGLAFFTS